MKDIEALSSSLSSSDIIFGDIEELCELNDKIVTPSSSISPCKELTEYVSNLFDHLASEFGDTIKGYANNFQECSVEPLLRYLISLRETIDKAKESSTDVEVVFPNRFIFTKKSSTYYLAEHESQGVHLYSREIYYYSYIKELCKNLHIRISYRGIRLGIKIYIWDFLRLWLVYFYRLYVDIKKSFLSRTKPLRVSNYDIVVITRSSVQSLFVAPFIRESKIRFCLIASESFLSNGENITTANKVFYDMKNTEIIAMPTLRVRSIFKKYISAVHFLVGHRREFKNICGFHINLTHAIKEVAVMHPSLQLYEDGLNEVLNQIPNAESETVLSTEQKSPHAYIDAKCSNGRGYKCFHLMYCDQHPKPLPFPVPGDIFLADTYTSYLKFREVWGKGKNYRKVAYIGSIKAIKVHDQYLTPQHQNMNWCFFASDLCRNIFKDVNINLAQVLEDFTRESDIEYFIKLHPRDHAKHYPDFFKKKLSNFDMYQKILHNIDFAISYPSGIILDLIFQNIPFVIYAPHTIYNHIDYVYLNAICNPIFIETPKELEHWLSNPDELKKAFNEYRRKFIEINGIISDIKTIERNLITVIHE